MIGLPGVAAAWWLGSKAYGVVAGAVGATTTAVATVHVAYSRPAVADVLLTTLITASLALLVSGRVEFAGLAAGLAAAAKYPGVVAVVPIVVVAWGRWRRLGIASAVAVGAFVVGSPFVIRHLGMSRDAGGVRVHRWARNGWLGFENDSAAAGLRSPAACGRARAGSGDRRHRPWSSRWSFAPRPTARWRRSRWRTS